MNIVDSQVHLWHAETPDRPWPPGRAQDAQKPYPISKETMLFQMDLAGVRRAVIVPPSWEGDRNDVALAAAQSYPDRFAVMGRLDLKDPASPGKVATWKQQPGMLGMRFTFHNEHYRHLLTDGSTDWLWPALEAAGVPIMIIMPDALDHLDRIAAAHSGLRSRHRPRGAEHRPRPAGVRQPPQRLQARPAPERGGEGLRHAVAVRRAVPVPRPAPARPHAG